MIHNKDRLFDGKGKSFVLTRNLKGKNPEKWASQYLKNESFRLRKRSDSVYLTHEILSWHREDSANITLEKLEDIVGEYLRLRNENGIHVAVPHFDKSHYHVHICSSGIEYRTGKTMRLSKIDLHKLKKDIQNYQLEKYPELSKSVVAHGSNKTLTTDREKQINLRSGRESDKDQLLTIMKTCYKKANSKESFFELLAECGIHSYKRGCRISGFVFEKRKFRLGKLGFEEERINQLDKSIKRNQDLNVVREITSKYEKNKSKLI
jgi:hypothetical protein